MGETKLATGMIAEIPCMLLVARDRWNLDSALMKMGNYKMPGIARNQYMRLLGCLTRSQRKGAS